jgi:hypothetical protein
MAIPESQLDTWSHQGAGVGSRDTYKTVRTALESQSAVYKNRKYEVFLQGSYGNDTNIYGESDVDVVMRLDSIWRGDVSDLPADQQAAYHAAYGNAAYTFEEFKKGVVLRLSKAFGEGEVKPGNKAIKIKANGARRSSDVVPCYRYRSYYYFSDPDDQGYEEGIIFQSGSSGEVINFPKQHSENCTAKHQSTGEWFKPTVRILKNLRSRLVEEGAIEQGTAPSYYLEGMLWNVPDENFGGSCVDTVCACMNWILKTDRAKLKCANQQYLLLGDSNVQWPADDCDAFLAAALKLWKEWGN